MTSALEVNGAVDGEIFERDKMGRIRVSRARREALLNEVAGPAERSLPTMLGSNIQPLPLGFKSDSATKCLGLGLAIRAGC
jgi:hypothetical protein